jgi:uncharacterized membrane protein
MPAAKSDHVQRAVSRGPAGRAALARMTTFGRLLPRLTDGNVTPAATHDIIVGRRRAFRWMPVLFSNDLVHGSWWFVLGSLFTTIVSAILLANLYVSVVGEEDSILTLEYETASWTLLVFSGLVYTVGSVVFTRALYLPRLPPLMPCWRHVATDELLASWLFLLGTLPAVPYCALFLASRDAMLYWCMLAAGVFAVLACAIFVYVCYPSERQTSIALHALERLVGKRESLTVHFENDLLFASWMAFVGCFIATGAFLLYTLYAGISEDHHCGGACLFLNISSTVDCALFLVGSAYFVAGSYSEDKPEPGETAAAASRA